MRISRLDRMLLSGCFQAIGKEVRERKREPLQPCNTVQEFEAWRINFFNRLMAEPYDKNEPLELEAEL